MIVLSIKLVLELYAACSWDTAHVEAIPEWPPSPWRIYRAIYAGFFDAREALGSLEQDSIDEIITTMAKVAPSYYLPADSYVQTRTYRRDRTDDLKLYKSGKQVVSGELRFHPDDTTIYIFWDCELTLEQKLLLNSCLNFCAYLGRRESEAKWSIASGAIPEPNCFPDLQGNLKVLSPGKEFKLEYLLLTPRQIFDRDRQQYIPGAEWKDYRLERPKQFARIQTSKRQCNYIKLDLIAAFPLSARQTLYYAEKLHKALVDKCASSNFTGCDERGNYARDNYHAYLLPIIEKDSIVSFEFCSARGFSPQEQKAFAMLNILYTKLGQVTLKIVASGEIENFCSKSKVWQTITPMFLPRYPATRRGKARMLQQSMYQKDGPEHQALKLILHLPQFEHLKSKEITYLPTEEGLEQHIDGKLFCRAKATIFKQYWKWHSDRQAQSKQSLCSKTVREGYQIQLTFEELQRGAMAIGYAAHYGLGVLSPLRERIGVEKPRLKQLAKAL